MSATTPKSDEPLRCALCQATRAEHDEMNHEFSLDGRLVPKKKVAGPQRVAVPADSVLLRLINTLANKGVLTPQELGQIFPPAPIPTPDADSH